LALIGTKEAVLVFGRKARAIERRYFLENLLYFAGFLLAEFDRGHIAALRRIINGTRVGAPNGATFRHSIVFVAPRRDFPQIVGNVQARLQHPLCARCQSGAGYKLLGALTAVQRLRFAQRAAATLARPLPGANLELLILGDALGMCGPLSNRTGTCRALAMVIALLSIILLSVLSAGPAAAERRIALVVGNSAYQNITRLDNPRNDATLMAETLSGLGFALIGGSAQLDLDKAALDTDVQNFGRQIQGADVALFYYAGHGVQVNGSNYLVPISANPTREADVDFQMVDINLVLRQMQGSGTRLNLVILDACRNNPFGARGLRSADGGLAQMRAPEGTLISYATQPGSVAQDGSDGHSPYTKALATTIKQAGLDIFQTFNQVGLAVKRQTGGSQQPWVSSSPIDGSFYFVAPAGVAGPKVATAPQPQTTDTLRHDSDSVPSRGQEPEQPHGSDDGGGSNFDGTWSYTGIGTNCPGSGSGFLVISGGLVSSKNGRGIGRVSPDGTYRAASVGADGVALTATGRMSGNGGSGSYRRADGCRGRWAAKKL
jgi:hypothetical protein